MKLNKDELDLIIKALDNLVEKTPQEEADFIRLVDLKIKLRNERLKK